MLGELLYTANMIVTQIYKKFDIPINLQQHMLRVAAVSQIICDSSPPIDINRDVIVKTCLLHDMGNIIKMDFAYQHFFIKSDQKKIDQYKQIQTSFTSKYGSDADKATWEIIKKITQNSNILNLFANSHGEHTPEFINGDYWDRKILYYSDMRVGPFGVTAVNQRFGDLKKRYPRERKNLKRYQQQCLEIEQQLQAIVKIDLNKIDNRLTTSIMEALEKTDF